MVRQPSRDIDLERYLDRRFRALPAPRSQRARLCDLRARYRGTGADVESWRGAVQGVHGRRDHRQTFPHVLSSGRRRRAETRNRARARDSVRARRRRRLARQKRRLAVLGERRHHRATQPGRNAGRFRQGDARPHRAACRRAARDRTMPGASPRPRSRISPKASFSPRCRTSCARRSTRSAATPTCSRLGVHGSLSPQQDAYVERIRRSQQHLLGIINDLLNYTRIEAGQVTYDLRVVPLATVLSNVVPMIEPQAESRAARGCRRHERERLRARRSGEGRADHAEPPVQRGEVHAGGRARDARGVSRGRARGNSCHRHGHRNRGRQARDDLRAVRADRTFAQLSARRHGPRTRDQPRPRARDAAAISRCSARWAPGRRSSCRSPRRRRASFARCRARRISTHARHFGLTPCSSCLP